ncbi:MAG: helix-turn-helix transcriptional regulator [Chloroflexota bacterium]
MTGLSEDQVRGYADRGLIPANVKQGSGEKKTYRFVRKDIEAWLDKGRTEQPPATVGSPVITVSPAADGSVEVVIRLKIMPVTR